MRTDDFDFELPDDRIALRPVRPRDAARLLVVRPGETPPLADHIVRDLPSLLRPGDLLVLNDTRVIEARLDGLRRRDGAGIVQVEATLIERLAPDRWLALAKPGKRLKVGDRITFAAVGEGTAGEAVSPAEKVAAIPPGAPPLRPASPATSPARGEGSRLDLGQSLGQEHDENPPPSRGREGRGGATDASLAAGAAMPAAPPSSPVCALTTLHATIAEKREAGEIVLAFELSGPDLDLAIAGIGRMPLPPYIAARRPEDAADRHDYQTVYAREPGAVAAPTAGLHLTPELFAALEARGIGHAFVTLHVGAGTFLPVKTDTLEGHRMHVEHGTIAPDVAARINAVRASGGRIVAVGTTALRILESAADDSGTLHPFAGGTDIFISPGYRFRIVDALMTNFHLPRSTLFMLVSAFSGLATMQAAYAHAVATGYRFYSYGDASLLFPETPR
ncbi:tRNA preQ1(34) S-adenosylmethionine ribosyltransferase-isomerase QueA [Pseudoxanthobacter sp. M-2]|uniref:tRNA preQ1(34) S-adenosylmethionine ribosyltransferase-isomerase QueA n=1 Tax=Pseudoxanthobacter sp. M-2 TaxID=3078754 RepID=UPI0038FC877A